MDCDITLYNNYKLIWANNSYIVLPQKLPGHMAAHTKSKNKIVALSSGIWKILNYKITDAGYGG